MKANVKKANIRDIKKLNQISFRSKMYWNYPQEWMEKWKDDLEFTKKDFIDQNIIKVEDESGLIAGFCSIKEHEHEYEIFHLWIKPEYIGKGLGKYLLNESIRLVAIKDKPIIVEADPHAESFYSKIGFKTIGKRRSFPENRFLPIMKKEYQSIQ